ncbi:MAG TPA: hypothetical protein DEF39_03485 [Hungateiclostridium thermocellum]|jgi:Gpi18-like mannosyltransferase|uniref:DUF2029 domain-containing protein n=2 Tax=Acetivibrio thermocellus TaxID=1515 RepID=A3DHC4_ACET2|nr:hypothetical protein [Acetivibrio thermocellus]CDG36667.1 integral hypothetical protein [Acetivibrio thermocellus BC1]ABN53353.1 hypothetical protein Cthe_2150 [Acetivibrio thermocellus ATCC 27405]ADU75788.1 hypothetical protein Clo1313_2808 [Acetivibrio thermocellus DSM 1313]ALX09820.1 GPI transamidase subunit PIG-U [Acetivibrio thermocellus AD2]ANV77594.1 GPI transamidase subunit PIG-U [Acetivibrio thermocellus DSM 2360]
MDNVNTMSTNKKSWFFEDGKPVSRNMFIITGTVVILIRLLLTTIPSYQVDMGGYRAWSLYLAENGPVGFYERYHVVYAPAYMYLLWITGIIAKAFSVNASTHAFLIKLWAVASELVGAYLIYKIGKKYKKERLGFILGVVYALNPGVFFNSSIWGQFDSIPATLLVGMIYAFSVNRKMTAVVLYAIAVLTKPQSALLTPLGILFYKELFDFSNITKEKIVKSIKETLVAICVGLSCYFIVIYPFYYHTDLYERMKSTSVVKDFIAESIDYFWWMPNLYLTSVEDYPYATANAFNLWTLLGGQPVKDSNIFFILSYKTWGTILFLICIGIAFAYLLKKRKSDFAMYFASFFILSSAFTFITRMHERYLLPAIIFLTICVLWEKWMAIPLTVLSVCVTANHWYIYDLSWKDVFWLRNYDPVAMPFAFLTVLVVLFGAGFIIKQILPAKKN